MKTKKRFLSILLSLALVLGLMPGMSMTAYADDPYASLKNATTEITFDGKSWYLIDYDDSTVTLLAKECVGSSLYNASGSFVEYSNNPTVKTAVDNWYRDNITSDAKTAVSGSGMFLLTKEEADEITNAEVRKCENASGGGWWLCSQGDSDSYAAYVLGGSGDVFAYGDPVPNTHGVRPALKLNLSSVIFSSESNAFSLKPSDNTVTWSDLSDISIGEWESVTKDGVTVTLGSRSRFMNGDLNLGSCIFTASQGGISGITIQTGYDLREPDGGWPSGWIADGKTLTWSGDPAVEVSLEGMFLYISSIQQITFTMSDTGTGTKTVWTNETIEIDGEVTVNRRIIVNGNVTLNLKEGSKLIANAGINVSAGNSLTIQGSGELIARIDEQQSLQADNDMAAIGGNDGQDAGTVTITGGTIEAHGGANAAGIGGGDGGNGGTVNISGGTVTAIGGSFGAGIGGGNGKNGGTVNISGGTVIAIGGQYGKNGGSSSGIGKNGYGSDDGSLTLGDGVVMQVSSDNTTWSEYGGSDRARYMKSHIPAIDILVTGLTLDKTTTQIIDEGNKVSFTATVSPDNASDKTVKWSVGGTNADAVTLYSNEACTTAVGTDATSTLTVYAKGISAGSATVTCTSNADSEKSASCNVTVNAYAGNPYASLVNTTTSVKFNDMDWYIIADDSTAVDAGTVTLLSKDPIGASKFHESEYSVYVYSISLVKDYLDSLTGTGGTFEAVADAIVTVKVKGSDSDSEVDAKLWLLSTSEAEGLSEDVRKCSTAMSYFWWLRSRGFDPYKAARVYCEEGEVSGSGDNAWYEFGVRPALKLDLSKVTFDSATKTFTYGSPAAVHTHDGITFTAWDSADSLPAEAGNYYLTKDVIIDRTWSVPTGENKLCLNGHGIRYNGSAETSVVKVDSGATLNLYDCDAETKHYITLTDGRGTAVNEVGSEGAMEINGGYITGGKARSGGGVSITGGTFSLYGGTIIGCTAQFGGGVYVYNSGAFNLIGGTITGCTAAGDFQYGGGVYSGDDSSFTMSGGSISENSAKDGGGVYVNSGSFTMSGGSIDGNSASGYGGGVYLENKSASFTMSGGSINGNLATVRSGGVYRGFGQITLSDAPDIFENYAGESRIASNLDLNNEYASAVIGIGGALDSTAKIRITMQKPGVFTSGWKEQMGSADPADYFIMENPGLTDYAVKRTAEGEARLAKQIDINVTTDQHGTVTAQVGSVNATKAYQDETVTLNVTPDPGYHLKTLTVSYSKSEVTEMADLAALMGSAVFSGERDETPFTIKAEDGNFVLTVGNDTYTSREYTDFKVGSGNVFYASNPNNEDSEWMFRIGNNGRLTVSFYPYSLSGTPNGAMPEKTADLTTVTDGSKYTFVMTPTAAQVVAEFESSHTHSFTYSADGATITAECANTDGNCPLVDHKATLTVNAPALSTYGGSESAEATITGTIDGVDNPAIVYKKGSDVLTTAPTDAGTYTANITLGGATASVEYTISPREVTVSGITAGDKTYDGNTTATLNTAAASFTGKLNGDTLTVSATGAFENANAGEDKTVVISGLTLGGTDKDNYVLATEGQQTNATAKISAKEIGLTWSNTDLIYNGLTQAPTAMATGLVSGDTCTVTVSGEQINVGNNYTATASSLSNSNYKLPENKTTTFKISRANAIAATVTANNRTYDGTEKPLVTVTGETTGGTLKFAVTTENQEPNSEAYTFDTTSIPTATAAGTYYVWYKVKADDTHIDSNPFCVTVKISKKPEEEEEPEKPAEVKTVAMYRLYNPFNREHLYTESENEKNVLSTKYGWKYEGIAWYAPEKSNTPVYRLYNPVLRDHHYTTDKHEKDVLSTKYGWKYEGIGWYSDDNKTVPIYRVFCPFITSGSHHFTAGKNEVKHLISVGWIDEKIGWYGVKEK